MLSFFRRKKPQDAPAAEAPKTQHYSAEELAAAFPSAAPVEDKEPAPAAVAAEPAPVESPPAAVAPVAVEPTPVIPAPAAPVPAAPAPKAQIDVAPIATPAIEPAPAPLPGPTPAPAPVTDDLPAAASVDAVPATAGKPGWRERLRNSVIARSFGGLFSRNPKLDDDLLDELETALITADVGVGATTDLVEGLRKRMKSREFADANALLAALRAELIAILQPVAKPLVIDRTAKPFVVLTVGVNGVGKTTTIGKLAKRFKDDGHSLMLAAGDTFRAAAVAQLQAWGERNGVAVVAQGQNADAASVAFDALQAGKARGTSVLIADTAGRLHTQSGLMNELGKIRRVLGKIDPTAPHEVLMVIDGTTGQNALSQLRQFNAAVNVTGLVVTKLDGTAKGGVVFALAREFGIPIRFAGIGERPEDLRVFDPEAFVDALLPEALGA
ncbi:signal recognition particle-docking protein FtsY [Stenotrophomonas maltophilia]|uniref:Signal recognition particle receptor FtsY n=1 Tax=Stenotrophomonas geniculata N1 TaxID=1167641 RepID=A0A0L8ABA9_9GAMM|nr:signal recognition particle-docking protein FtsY [Stenotrophomonas geniculata]MBH1407867.1 signal recognition particle-docking protein FtsY [Stenotrophomonas maltophilia]KOE99585.1 cell division protein FtsY [Stenotrophomonas geniculata N1]MBN4972065.1 signal recognition particle-docking protein FtsY [Stenotrophomonas maltophilia]MBN5094749.1 signal recognition particle-docking protein FtsY [Stenotrophomonas maltophilia]MDP9618057.1 fused signal recognition particle receptor [Stenotrophomon